MPQPSEENPVLAATIAGAERTLIDIATRYFTGDYLQRDGATLVASARESIALLRTLRATEPPAPLVDAPPALSTGIATFDEPPASAYEEPWLPPPSASTPDTHLG